MSIEERDWDINNPYNASDWYTDRQYATGNGKLGITVTININPVTGKYRAEVNTQSDIITILYETKPLTRSYHEMRKHLIKWLASNDKEIGLPTSEEYWNLICKM